MTKLGELYSDFFRIDLDTRGGYSRVSNVVVNSRSGFPNHCAFKLMRHELESEEAGMRRFESELQILTETTKDVNRPTSIISIYDSGFAPIELSKSLQVPISLSSSNENQKPSPDLEIISTGPDIQNFLKARSSLKSKEPDRWLPYLVVELASYDDCLLRQINAQSASDVSDPRRLSVSIIVEMALQLLDVMEYLHRKFRLAYTDWKPEHIFWNENTKQAKLIDWNVVRSLNDGRDEKQVIRDDIRLFCGAVLYTSLALSDPENLTRPIGPRPTMSGELVLDIARRYWTDKPNFYERENILDEKIKQIVQKGLDPNQGFNTPQELKDVLNQYIEQINVEREDEGKENAIKLQIAIETNRLTNNRSQPVLNDRAQGEDQLGIKDEVEALAETLLLRDVDPPLAVGVLGGWGSGKSFVMYLIDEFIRATRAQRVKKGWPDSDEKDPKIPVFVGHVYQIHFNAWTYAKSNLWASLMDTIFSCLNRQMQLERLLAYREFSPGKPPTKEQIRDSMLAGGDEFKKIYLDNPQIGQDKDLGQWRKNLDHWGQHLLKGTLLWNIMRGQQVETLEKLKDTEEQLKQLKTRREQFEKDRPLNEITTKALKDKTARHTYFQSIKSFMLAFLSNQLTATAKDELKKQDVKEKDVQKFLEEAKGLWGGLTTLFNAFRQSRIYLVWTVIFLILFFAVPYLWSTYALDFVQLQVARAITFILTILPTLRVIVPWIQKSIQASIESKKILEGAYATQQAKEAEEIATSTDMPLPQKISKLQAEISNGSLPAYDALIGLLEAQAEEQRQKIGPSAKYSNLMEFVQSRLDAATYENQLGLMHQVRQDIDELTFSLVDNASPDAFPRGKPRVILYIDDLDRCPPPRVVEMLEAVQLLLNTKLFIVILGLDTRYVTRALEKEYKEILQHEGDPSGLDYIEKIIQIPYRVRAIEKDNLRLYIEKQMDIEKAPGPESAMPSIPSDESRIPSQATELVQPTQVATQPDEEPQTVSQSIPQQPVSPPPVETKAPEPPKPSEIELPAEVIQFKQEDLDDLAVCCQKIMLTPRSIKRLVNVFKLMKIFWFRADKDAGIAERDRPRAVKQAAMSLLALSSAYPEVMREVFVHLDVLYRQGQEKTELFTALINIKLPPGSAKELSWQLQKYKADISSLKAIVGNGQDKFGQLALQDLKLSTFNIVRSFSFVGDPVYWTDDDEDVSRQKEPAPTKAKSKTNGKSPVSSGKS